MPDAVAHASIHSRGPVGSQPPAWLEPRMQRAAMTRPHRLGALLLGVVLLLSGCTGGSVALRSGLPPPAAPPAAGAGQAGLSVSGSGGLTLGIMLALILADGLYWASSRSDDAADATAGTRAAEPARRLFQPIDRGWVDRGP